MWFWFSLSAAILSAFENIINKKTLNNVDATIFTWALFSLSIPIFGFLAFKDGLPTINTFFWIGTIGSGLAFGLGKTINSHSLKKGTLSKLLPLTSLTVLFTYILGIIFLSEAISLGSVSGLLFIVTGAYILNADKAKEDLLKPLKVLVTDKASILYLFALFLASVATIFDKTAINNSFPTNISLVLFIDQIIMTFLITIYLNRYQKNWTKELKANFWILFFISMLYAGISYISFLAFSEGSVALSQGIKRSQVLFTLLLGIAFLNDKPTKHIWIATFTMIIGVILIKIYT